MAKIYEIFGTDAEAMTLALMERAQVAALLPPGGSVALKPNLVTDAAPEDGATTHPGVLSGCIAYLRRHGVKDISVIEGAWVGAQTERAMKLCGYDKVCAHWNVPFYDLKRDSVTPVETPLRPIEICDRALRADFLINLPVLKGHGQTRMTCALKNCKGCIPDREKRRFHTEGLHRPIAALAAALRPGLTIVDSICGDLNFEEGGNPIQTNRMYLGTDPVQLDAYGCFLMGLDPAEVRYIGLAAQYGAGDPAFSPEDLVQLNEPQAGAAYPKASHLVKQLTRSVREKDACSACYASLVRALYVARNEGMDGSGNLELCIGQGWKGKAVPGLGVGVCCSAAKDWARGCPPSAAEVLELLRRNA